MDAVKADGVQGIDLLPHLHRPEFRGVGAAGSAGYHDGDDQNADLPQHEDTNHIDDIFVGTELAEMKESLLGDDAANQECNEQNDWHGAPADTIQVVDGGCHAKGARMPRRSQQSKTERTDHIDEGNKVSPNLHYGFADALGSTLN